MYQHFLYQYRYACWHAAPMDCRCSAGTIMAGYTVALFDKPPVSDLDASCCHSAFYPIDTIKTRMQAMIGGGGIGALLQSGGGKGLYAGVWGNLAGVAPASAIFISVYEPVKKWVQGQLPDEKQFFGPIVAGASAGLVSSLVR